MQHRRRIILVDRKFQLRYSLYVCSWIFALSLVYPLIIYSLFDYFSSIAAQNPYGPTAEAIASTRHEVLIYLIALQALFMGITFLISIFTSHRIAGPLYKLRQFFARARDGQLSEPLKFRKADHFQDMADDFNAMTGALRARMDQARGHVEKALAGANPEARRELERALQSLGPKA